MIILGLVSIASFLGNIGHLIAQETVLEFDFRNTSGDKVEALIAKAGSSTVGHMEGAATVTPDADGPEGSVEAIQKGILEISADGSLSMMNTAGGSRNHTFKDYSTTERFGRGTIVAVVQPDFYDVKRPTGHMIFNTASQTLNDPNKFYLSLTKDGVEFSAQSPSTPERRVVRIEQPTWDAGKWYVIAISWEVGEKMTAYLREFGSSEGLFAESDDAMVDSHFENIYPILLGNTALKNAPFDGKISYFLWNNAYLRSADEFATLYAGLVKP